MRRRGDVDAGSNSWHNYKSMCSLAQSYAIAISLIETHTTIKETFPTALHPVLFITPCARKVPSALRDWSQ